MLKIALTGLPGAGKSTSSGLILDELRTVGETVEVVKLARPLYDVQACFYNRMSEVLPADRQDGKLLNFLGSHFREASTDFLIRDMLWRCDAARLAGASIALCDDARPLDLGALSSNGFVIVRIVARDELRIARKAARGDRFAGRDDHPTELAPGGVGLAADYTIENNGSVSQLRAALQATMARIRGQTAGQGALFPKDPEAPVVAELLARARQLVDARYQVNRHQIAAALLTAEGRIFTGLHVEAMVGRASICAEAVALGKALEAGAGEVVLCVALRHPKPIEADRRVRIVPPCGLCREILLDYGPNVQAVLENEGRPYLMPLSEMLPHKYRGTKWDIAAQPSA